MPKVPVESILNRDLSRVAAQAWIQQFTPVIDEIVNYGTTVYARCRPTVTPPDPNEDSVPLLMYLHVLEMADGISELLKQVCATPAIPLARTIFEGVLGLEYILASDYSRRARSWLVSFTCERVEACDRILGKQKSGKANARAPGFDFSKLAPQMRADKKRYQEYLTKPEFKEVLRERQGRREKHPWYSLFSGPVNLRELAKRLNREKEYVEFYTYWSSIQHGVDIGRFLARGANPDQTTRVLRDPNDPTFKVAAMAAAVFTVWATRLVLSKYHCPGEDFSKWYRQEIKPRLDHLYAL
jgi:hypothetical protein